jgi:DNA-binding IclR family transcriptional regulator
MNEQPIPTVDGASPRAFAVLEVLSLAPTPLKLSAVAAAAGLGKSTTHRILATLIELGYAEAVEASGCYAASLKLWELGERVATGHPVKRAAAGFLSQLHRTTGETVSLTILAGDDVLYLDKIISPRPVRFTTRVGSRVPAVLTAGGKAMLAHAPDAEVIVVRSVARLAGRHRLDPAAVAEELAAVRRDGYAISSASAGVISVAAPVMAREGHAAAALSVSAPAQRVGVRQQAQIIEAVLSTCALMADRVGHL